MKRSRIYTFFFLLALAGCNKEENSIHPTPKSSTTADDTNCTGSPDPDVYSQMSNPYIKPMHVRASYSQYQALSSTASYFEGDSVKLILARPICAGTFDPRNAYIYIDDEKSTPSSLSPCAALALTLTNFTGNNYNVRFAIPTIAKLTNSTTFQNVPRKCFIRLVISPLSTDTGANTNSYSQTFSISSPTGSVCLPPQ